MAATSKIEWTDATWQIVTGCSVVSPGCKKCYAMRLAGTRLRNHPSRAGLTQMTKAGPVWTGEVRFNEQWLEQPLHWKKPRRIFVCAHGDLFHENVPDEWIDRVFSVMGDAHWHQFQVLTKRVDRMQAYLANPETKRTLGRPIWPLRNVWLGVSVEDQERANERIPLLLETPAAIRFLSVEPLLEAVTVFSLDGPVDVPDRMAPGIDLVIVGGESGPKARDMDPDWARSIRDQCQAASVAFFMKQMARKAPIPDDLLIREMPDTKGRT